MINVLELKDKLPTATWCPQILTGIAIQSKGVTPCCEFAVSGVPAQSVKEYKESHEYKNLLKNMNNGIWSKGCYVCEQKEKQGLVSQRLTEVKTQLSQLGIHNRVEIEPFYEIYNKNQYLWVNVQPSNKCNLACIMCWPGSSSTIFEEVEKYGEKHWKNNDVKLHNYNNFASIANHRHPKGRIYLSGGEPSMMNDVIKYLDSIPNPEEIKLSLNSNFQLFNKRFWKILQKFKNLYIMASVDGIGKRAEYIRYHSNWKQVEYNILKTRELLPTAFVTVTPCWTMVNIWYANEVADWCKNNNLTLSIDNVAMKHSWSVINCFDSYKEQLMSIFKNSYFPKYDVDTKQIISADISGVISIIKNATFTKKQFYKFVTCHPI